MATAGWATGQAVWTLAASIGIAELIQASEPAFLAMKAVGAAYLVALGLQPLWTAAYPLPAHRLRSPTGGPGAAPGGSGATPGGSGATPGGPGAAPGGSGAAPGGPGAALGGSGAAAVARLWLTPGRALRQGVVSNLANPKMAAFF